MLRREGLQPAELAWPARWPQVGCRMQAADPPSAFRLVALVVGLRAALVARSSAAVAQKEQAQQPAEPMGALRLAAPDGLLAVAGARPSAARPSVVRAAVEAQPSGAPWAARPAVEQGVAEALPLEARAEGAEQPSVAPPSAARVEAEVARRDEGVAALPPVVLAAEVPQPAALDAWAARPSGLPSAAVLSAFLRARLRLRALPLARSPPVRSARERRGLRIARR